MAGDLGGGVRARAARPGLPEFPLAGVGILYGALLAVLIGSLASAEERQNGTLEWQLLLPMAAWKQWAVKVGTVLVLTALLSYCSRSRSRPVASASSAGTRERSSC